VHNWEVEVVFAFVELLYSQRVRQGWRIKCAGFLLKRNRLK
jgi:hypothetical protein